MKNYLIILLFFLGSCAAKKQAAEFEALPDWVKQKPIIPGYYVGIASVKKVGTSAQYIATAQQQALSDLAESVSSNISSTSVLRAIETKYGYSETFDQKIQVSTDDYLEGFEPVDSYETEDSYWVYYKIDKSTYQEMKEKRKKEAIATALAKYQSGLQEQQINKPKEALAFYLQGLQAIKRYLNEENPTIYNNQNIDIGNELFASINNILNALTIEANRSSVNVKRGDNFKEALEFLVTYKGHPVQGIPVTFLYSGGYLKNDKKDSDAQGFVRLEPETIYSKNEKEQITTSIDLKELAQKSVDDIFIRGLIQKHYIKPATVDIFIQAPSITIIIDKTSCTENQYKTITSTFNENIRQFGFINEPKNQADYILELYFGYRQGESAGGLVSVYISGELIIKGQSGKTIWTKQTESIKGVGNSVEGAKNKAFEEFVTALNRKFFKQGLDSIK
ncbi:MAG: LPP20 family lipoprotein [Bacteroidota bacterium]